MAKPFSLGRLSALLAAVLTALTLLMGLRSVWREHMDLERQHIREDLKHEREDERRDQHIRVLEHIIVGEWPAYTLSVYPPKE